MAGASVGLGNIWRFPYTAGENGGGAFVLVYLGFILIIGLPLVMAEMAIGRRGSQNPVSTTQALCREEGKSRFWQAIGWMSVISPLLAMTFYSVIAGWSLHYLLQAAAGAFGNISGVAAKTHYDELLASPKTLVLLHTAYLIAQIYVIGRGVQQGIELASKYMMPLLYALLVITAIYANLVGDAGAAWRFLFNPDFSKLTSTSILMALGQALFSISVGTGAIITYGAYIGEDVSIRGAAISLGIADTSAALLAGLAIFPVVFAAGLNAGEGPGLMFVTLPVAFGGMPGGQIFATLFFALVFFAAFTSSLAMLEPCVSWLTERTGWRRMPVSICAGFGVWLVGLSTVFSFNILAHVKPLSMIAPLAEKNIFGLFDFIVSNLMLPINALLIALFVGWVLGARRMAEEMNLERSWEIAAWRFTVRFLAPLAIVAIFAFSLKSGL